MSAKKLVFIDTNILIYRSFGTTFQKQKIQKLLAEHDGSIVISVQVLNEFINASVKKKFFETEQLLDETLHFFINNFQFAPILIDNVTKANGIRRKYKLSYYDSLIIATALESKCEILYSEDLQHGLLLEKKLKIANPLI